MLILESIINDLCKQNEIDFMEFRLWIGIWTAIFLLLIVMFNLSFLVKYITRFTEDCFATLVAIIFIIDAIKSTLNLRHKKVAAKLLTGAALFSSSSNDSFFADDDESNYTMSSTTPALAHARSDLELSYEKASNDAVFFFSVLLFLLTFFVCMTLKAFRDKPFLPSKIRSVFSDFAVMIAIVIASAIDFSIGLATQKLTIPAKFEPTTPSRGWLISPFGKNSIATVFVAIVPALIATILVFMDQQITAVIINRKEFKLKKSNGYHLDLFIIAISIAVCSFLGLPWFVAATVLALTHVNSLKLMSENTAPGERPLFVGVREQRMTTLIMSVLIGLSVFLTSILQFIPMPVLYGVFMFMGVSALRGMQFFERLLLLFMPTKHQPDKMYLRHVSARRVHLFTVIQLVSTSGLYLIKFIESVAITFPILVSFLFAFFFFFPTKIEKPSFA
jgi:anion exchange protein